MFSRILFIFFFLTLIKAGFSQDWKNMYPLNDGDYWVYETFGPGGYLGGTDTRRVIGDTTELNGQIYKTVLKTSFTVTNDTVVYMEIDRIDTTGSILVKTPWDSTERLYLELNVEVGDTFQDPLDNFGGHWIVGNIWYSTDNKKNIFYFYNGIAYHTIFMKEDLGVYNENGEGGSTRSLKGAYINGQLIGDTTLVTSLEPKQEVQPNNFALFQNYPNPFNPGSEISFTLPEASRVVLEVYNIAGQKVAVLINEIVTKGHHTAVFDGSKLASGLYIYMAIFKGLSTGKIFSDSKRMLLVK